MTTEGLLGIDIGTSSCKAILIDRAGAVLASETAAYPLSIPQEGWSEQDPADWIGGAREAIAKLKRASGDVEVKAIGLSGQMHGLTPLDADLKVLRPAILWNDQRTEAECAEIVEAAGGLDALLALTNNQMLPGYTGGKIVWMRKHEPALYDKLAHALNPKDYLRLILTGEIATEVSDASGTGLFDVATRCWSQTLLEKTGIDSAILPACHESQVVSGEVSKTGAELFGITAGTPVVGGGGDAVIQTLGSGVVSPDVLQTTIGTAGIVATALDRALANPGGRLQVFCNVSSELWHCMGVSLNAGGALSWLRSLLAGAVDGAEDTLSFDRLVAKAAEVPPGSDGLLFLPYLMGERCPWPDPDARGAFVGLRASHDDRHIIRSLMEGVVFALADMKALMAEIGIGESSRLHASGGGSSASLWNQMQADVFGAEVLTVRGAAEGGAYGAALLAGVGTGVWRDIAEAAGACTPVERWHPDAARGQSYRELFDVYRALYPALTTVFGRLSRRG
ncbi:MAG: xylulokinase [Kiloniellales bacterium]|nr:xylulokinase [Kiloniellales bacterium]